MTSLQPQILYSIKKFYHSNILLKSLRIRVRTQALSPMSQSYPYVIHKYAQRASCDICGSLTKVAELSKALIILFNLNILSLITFFLHT